MVPMTRFRRRFWYWPGGAAAIRDRDAVASWLYGVAARVAAQTRLKCDVADCWCASSPSRPAMRPSRSRRASESSCRECTKRSHRLPERYRAPIVLCYLEGQSHEAAARIVRCRLRTLQTRLQRGKAAPLAVGPARPPPGTGLLAAGLAGGEHSAAAADAAMTPAKSMLRVGLGFDRALGPCSWPPCGWPRSSAVVLARCPENPVLESPAKRGRPVAVPAMGSDPGLFRTGCRGPGNRQACRHAPSAFLTTEVALSQAPTSGCRSSSTTMRRNTDGPADRPRHHRWSRPLSMPVPEGWRPQPDDRRFGLLGLVWAHAPGHQMAMANAW